MENQMENKEIARKRDKLTRNLFILPQFGGSTFKAYFDGYMAMLLTDVYMIPIVLSGILEAVKNALDWVASPVFGTFLDRFTFKNGKYWQWIIIGSVGAAISYMVLFTLPSITSAPEGLGFFVFLLSILIAVSLAIVNITAVSLYPRLSTDPKTRSYLAIGQKIGRDGGKTLWGYIVPALLIYFTAISGSEAGGWASTGYVLGIFGVLCYLVFAVVLKGSSIEKDAIAEKNIGASKKKPKVPLSVVLKGLITNRALLVMFLFLTIHKMYYFFQVMSATYFFKYVAQDFSYMGTFMLAFNLCAILGAVFGVVWVKIFKDSKKAFVAGGIAHIIILLIATLIFKHLSTAMFVVIISVASFFGGVIEAYLMPMFAAAADYGTWRTGEKADGLNMSIYSVSIRVGMTFSVMIRTTLLAAAGYNAAKYADGALPSAEVIKTLINLQTVLPLTLAIVCFGLVAFFYPLNDNKLAKIRTEIDADRVGKNADLSILN